MRNSRFRLHPHTLAQLNNLFFIVLGRNHSKEQFQMVYEDLLSTEERTMLSKRIAVMYLLIKGFDYNTICEVLKVAPGTVAKFSILLEKSGGLAPLLSKIAKNDQAKLLIEEIFANLFPPGAYGVNWKAAWERRSSIERKKQTGF